MGCKMSVEPEGWYMDAGPPSWDAKAKTFLAEKGYDSAFGARPLKRAVQKYLVDPLSRMILSGEIHDGDVILVGAQENALTFRAASNRPARRSA